MDNNAKTSEIVASGFRLMCWRLLCGMIACLLLFSIILPFAPRVEALTSGLELSPAKMSIDRPVRPGDRVALKSIKVTNTGESAARITITPHGAIRPDVTSMTLDPGVSGWFEAWLEVPKDAEAGQHEDTIDVKAVGADKMNNIMLQVIVRYETTAASASSGSLMAAISEHGVYVSALLFVLASWFLLKAVRRPSPRRRMIAAGRSQPAHLARLQSMVQPQSMVHPWYSPHLPPSGSSYPSHLPPPALPYTPASGSYPQQVSPFPENNAGLSLSERLRAYGRQEGGNEGP